VELLNFFDVRLFDVALEMAAQIENVDAQEVLVFLYDLLVGEFLAVIQIQQ
jgi:hypothetical protein